MDNFKERVRLIMIDMSKLYKEIYLDYNYLVCSEGFVKKTFYIIDAKKDNFQHLTGVHSLVSPKVFFDKCFNETLSEKDFDFIKIGQDEKSVKGTVRRKIKVLPNMMKLFKDTLLAEEGFQKNKVICSFAAADSSCTLGFTASEKVRPMSLFKGNELKNPKPVNLILRKKDKDHYFNEIILGDKDSLNTHLADIHMLVAKEFRNK